MKKNLLFIFAALFIFSAQAQNTLKLMSYNIKNANGMDNVCNFQRIANVINNAQQDSRLVVRRVHLPDCCRHHPALILPLINNCRIRA